VATAHFGGHLIVAGRRTDARQFVGGDCHAHAGAAQQDAAVGGAVANPPGNVRRDVGIVDGFVTEAAAVDHLVVHALEKPNQA
jgi:hypothetical protein